ncbi:hypothetical protein RRG08_045078, partial [Elysia crispata]
LHVLTDPVRRCWLKPVQLSSDTAPPDDELCWWTEPQGMRDSGDNGLSGRGSGGYKKPHDSQNSLGDMSIHLSVYVKFSSRKKITIPKRTGV